MAEFTAADVAKLREMTGAGMMECKKALTEAQGDLNAAVNILRKKGIAASSALGTREAKEGLIAQYIAPAATSAFWLKSTARLISSRAMTFSRLCR